MFGEDMFCSRSVSHMLYGVLERRAFVESG